MNIKRLAASFLLSIVFLMAMNAQATTIELKSPDQSGKLKIDGQIELNLSQKLAFGSIAPYIKLTDLGDNQIECGISYDEGGLLSKPSITIKPLQTLDKGTFYILKLSEGIKDENGEFLDINLDGSPGGEAEIMYLTDLVDAEDDLRETANEIGFEKLRELDFYPEEYDLWELIKSKEDSIIGQGIALKEEVLLNKYEQYIDYSTKTIKNLNVIDQVAINGQFYDLAMFDDDELIVVLDQYGQLVKDTEVLFKCHFYHKYKNQPFDSEVNVKTWAALSFVHHGLNNLFHSLKFVRDAAVSYVHEGEIATAVTKTMLSYVMDFPGLFIQSFVKQTYDELARELIKADEHFGYHSPPYQTYYEASFIYYLNWVSNAKAMNLMDLYDDIWEDEGNWKNQIKDIVTSDVTNIVGVQSETLGYLFKSTLFFKNITQNLFEDSTPLSNYLDNSNQLEKEVRSDAISEGFRSYLLANIGIIDLIESSGIDQPQAQNTTTEELNPFLSFSSFASRSGSGQKGYQIRVLDDGGTIIFNSGLVDETENKQLEYNASIESGYDPVSDSKVFGTALAYGNSYSWQVRYIDTYDNLSEWSNPGSLIIKSESEVFIIQIQEPSATSYSHNQVMNIEWDSNSPTGESYKVSLLKDGQEQKILTPGINGHSHSWSIPLSQSLGGNYQIRVQSLSVESVNDISPSFSIVEAVSGKDLAIIDIETDKSFYAPGTTIRFTYKVWNSGDQEVNGFVASIKVKDAQTGELISQKAKDHYDMLISKQRISYLDNTEAPQLEGFYEIQINISCEGDYKAGNNSISRLVYIGNSNPFNTYERGNNTRQISIGLPSNINGTDILVTAADNNAVRIRVDNEPYTDIPLSALRFFESDQLGLIYKGRIDNIVLLDYYSPTLNFRIDPVKLDLQAGLLAELDYWIQDDDAKQSVSFLEGIQTETDQDQVNCCWSLNSKVTSGDYSQGKIMLAAPSDSERKDYDFWIAIDGKRFLHRISASVIDPQPDFEPILSPEYILSNPGRTENVRIEIEPLYRFDEVIQVSSMTVPDGIRVDFPSGRVFGIDGHLDFQVAVDANIAQFGNQSIELMLSSDSQAKTIRVALTVIDPDANNISITGIQYIDTDQKMDSLEISFLAGFEYSPTAKNQDWSYHNGNEWISIASSQILDNVPYPPGEHSLIWHQPSGLYVPGARFRMNNRSGTDFLNLVRHMTPVDSDHNYAGIAFHNSVMYILDVDNDYNGTAQVQLYNADTEQYIRSYNLPFISDNPDNQIVAANGYFYIWDDASINRRIYQCNSDFSVYGSRGVGEDEDCMLAINNELYLFYDNGTIDVSRLIKLNANLSSSGLTYEMEYANAVRASFGFYHNDTIYLGDGDDLFRFDMDFAYCGSLNFGRNSHSASIYADHLYTTDDNSDIQLFSFFNPISLFTESGEFEINSSIPPEFIHDGSIILYEDQDQLDVGLGQWVIDRDTPLAEIEIDFFGISDGLVLLYDTTNRICSITLHENIDEDQSFRMRASDGINIKDHQFHISVIPQDDPAISLAGDTGFSFSEGASIKIPISELFIDVDNLFTELEYSEVVVSDAHGNRDWNTEMNLDNGYLFLEPEKEESGDFELSFQVTNPTSGKSTKIEFPVNVLPVNDPPGSFQMLGTLTGRVLPGEHLFQWSKAVDIDDDIISYELVIQSDQGTKSYSTVKNDIAYFIGPERIGELITWYVTASDGGNEVLASNVNGHMIVVEDSSSLYAFEQYVEHDPAGEVPENSPARTNILNLLKIVPGDIMDLSFDVTNSEVFECTESGELMLVGEVDYEQKNHYLLNIKVMYQENVAISTRIPVKISVNNVNEPPMISDSIFTIEENSDIGHFIGYIPSSDPESDDLLFSIINGDENGIFSIMGNSGAITLAKSNLLDFETSQDFDLVIEVADGEFSKLGLASIRVLDVNEQPLIDDMYFTVYENSEEGTIFGVIDASDPENDILLYNLISGNDDGAFGLLQSSGELYVSDSSQLDFETNTRYTLKIEACDAEFCVGSSMVVDVLDVLETTVQDAKNSPASPVVHPNPVSDILYVKCSSLKEIILMDLTGIILKNSFDNEINVSSLLPGAYILAIDDGKSEIYTIIIKE